MAEHKIDGNDGAGNAIAMARDNARDAALVEAAAVAIARKGNGEATLDHPYDKGYLAACDSCAAAILALRDKPAPAVTVRGWQPIETLPIGECVILIYDDQFDPSVIVYHRFAGVDTEFGFYSNSYDPTHWMPLPCPPPMPLPAIEY